MPDLLCMDQGQFRDILRKYLRGEATADERIFIDTWYINLGKQATTFPDDEDERSLQNRYWQRISAFMSSGTKKFSSHFKRWYTLGVAACAVLILVSYLNMSYGTSGGDLKNATRPSALVEYKKIMNQGPAAERVTLPDGSQVTLEPDSRLQYTASFDGPERKVYLDGKAFFEVVPNEERPFKVYTQKLVTKVLGTSFMVTAYSRAKEVTVAVKTGKVCVYTKAERDSAIAAEVILTPNQEFVYNIVANKGSRTIVEEPQALVPAEEVKRMRFEETSPKVIFEAIEKVYGVDIVFDEAKFSPCRITTSISDGNIFNRINIICEVMNATYRVAEDKIVIEGEGCQSNL